TDCATRSRVDRVRPQREWVTPDVNLLPGERGEREQPRGGSGEPEDAHLRANGKASFDECSNRGTNDERPPQTREVAVTVVRELVTGVHNSSDRRQQDRVTHPGGESCWPPAPQHNQYTRRQDDRESRCGKTPFEKADVLREFVERR